MKKMTEDEVRNKTGSILGFTTQDSKGIIMNVETMEYLSGVGQITTFNELGKKLGVSDFKGINDKPDGWYMSFDEYEPAIILETKSSDKILDEKAKEEVIKNCSIVQDRYDNTIGILYNGEDVRLFKNLEEIGSELSRKIQEGVYGIQYLDYKNLGDVFLEFETI